MLYSEQLRAARALLRWEQSTVAARARLGRNRQTARAARRPDRGRESRNHRGDQASA